MRATECKVGNRMQGGQPNAKWAVECAVCVVCGAVHASEGDVLGTVGELVQLGRDQGELVSFVRSRSSGAGLKYGELSFQPADAVFVGALVRVVTLV